LCWEFIRTATVARLLDRVDIVIGGSCWWQRSDTDSAANLAILRTAPQTFARLLGVPVVHASHAGPFEGGTVSTRDVTRRPFHYLGETQIVDGTGMVLARLSETDGEAVVIADITPEVVTAARPPVPDRFWIPEMPEGWDDAWRASLAHDREYYLEHTRPALLSRLSTTSGMTTS
jgi:predicted amidohydrolase